MNKAATEKGNWYRTGLAAICPAKVENLKRYQSSNNGAVCDRAVAQHAYDATANVEAVLLTRSLVEKAC
jgi:hypothetical protein